MAFVFNPLSGQFDQTGAGAAQVNSDWNATSGVSQILNKPTIQTFDQSLNTTDSPQFNNLVATDTLGGQTVIWGFGTGTNSQGSSDGSISLYDRPNFTGFPSSPPSNTLVGVANDLWFYRSGSNKYKVLLAGYHSSTDLYDTLNLCRRDVNNNIAAGQSITAAANTSALTASYSVTGANTTPLVSLTGTWNTTGVARGILLNITDTASASTSLLIDIGTGGASYSSKFSVTKFGSVSCYQLNTNGSQINCGSVLTGLTNTLGWANGDCQLYRDAANTLALRNGTTANTLRVFNTFTDSANYERGVFDWTTNTNALTIGTQKAGTGTGRRLRINSAEQIDFYCTDTSRMFQMSSSGNTSFGTFTWQSYSSASDPTTSTAPFNNGSGFCALWRNTTTGVVKLWANNAGTMVGIALA
jgi:hypothetical protein